MRGRIVPVYEAAHVTKLVNSWVEIRGSGLRSSSLYELYCQLKEGKVRVVILQLKMDLKENRKALCLICMLASVRKAAALLR